MASAPWYRNPEMIVALSALVVSIATVAIGAYSAWIDRSYARAAVWPRLEAGRGFDGSHFAYFVANRGTGPALIRQVRVALDGEPASDWSALMDRLGLPQRRYMQSQVSGRTLSPGQVVEVLQVEETALLAALVDASSAGRLDVRLCYCSIYDQCWTTDGGLQSEPVERCTLPIDEQFRQ
ncbi:MAG: hypothetical protein ABF271_04550 [Abyssibacter sp.]|uniref:hypothetical protein n=1 Tax=Abyssibacter sp. TaxID=2320200 RepID=UPI00321AC1BB